MIGIDTNVLVRYIVQDDPEQSALAIQFVEKQCSDDTPGYINIIVFCELVWVLSTAYKYKRAEIIPVLKQLLITNCFEIQESQLIWNALFDFEKQAGDFADYLIAQINKSQDVEPTFTFDKQAAQHNLFKILN